MFGKFQGAVAVLVLCAACSRTEMAPSSFTTDSGGRLGHRPPQPDPVFTVTPVVDFGDVLPGKSTSAAIVFSNPTKKAYTLQLAIPPPFRGPRTVTVAAHELATHLIDLPVPAEWSGEAAIAITGDYTGTVALRANVTVCVEAPDGMACGDLSGCSGLGTCRARRCEKTAPLAEGTACTDGCGAQGACFAGACAAKTVSEARWTTESDGDGIRSVAARSQGGVVTAGNLLTAIDADGAVAFQRPVSSYTYKLAEAAGVLVRIGDEQGGLFVEGSSATDGHELSHVSITGALDIPAAAYDLMEIRPGVTVVQVHGNGAKAVVAVDPARGIVLWLRRTIETLDLFNQQLAPLFHDDEAVLITTNESLQGNVERVELLSGARRGSWPLPLTVRGAILEGDVLYVSGLRPTAVDPMPAVAAYTLDGTQLWIHDARTGDKRDGAAAPRFVRNGRLLLADGEVLDAASGALLAVSEESFAAAQAGDAHVFVNDKAISTASGKPVWLLPSPDIFGSAVDGDQITYAIGGPQAGALTLCRRDGAGTLAGSTRVRPAGEMISNVTFFPDHVVVTSRSGEWEAARSFVEDFALAIPMEEPGAPLKAAPSPPLAVRPRLQMIRGQSWRGIEPALQPAACVPGSLPALSPVHACGAEFKDADGSVHRRERYDAQGRPLTAWYQQEGGTSATTWRYSGEHEVSKVTRWSSPRATAIRSEEHRYDGQGRLFVSWTDDRQAPVAYNFNRYSGDRLVRTEVVREGDAQPSSWTDYEYGPAGGLRRELSFRADGRQLAATQYRTYPDGTVRWVEHTCDGTECGSVSAFAAKDEPLFVFARSEERTVRDPLNRVLSQSRFSSYVSSTTRYRYGADGSVVLKHAVTTMLGSDGGFSQVALDTTRPVFQCGGPLLREEVDVNDDGVVDGIHAYEYAPDGRLLRETFTGPAQPQALPGTARTIEYQYECGDE